MNNFFNADNFFFRFMTKFFDAVLLSITFSLFCLPIVTIGPAITALYYSTVKCLRRGRGYVLSEFLRAFKRDFKQSFILEIILLVVAYILYLDLRVSLETGEFFVNMFHYVYLGVAVLVSFIAIYAFPIISRFQLRTRELLKLSLFMSIRHLMTTLVSIVLLLGAFVSVYLSYGLALFLTPVVTVLLISIMMERHLKACMKMVDKNTETDNKDEWYLE